MQPCSFNSRLANLDELCAPGLGSRISLVELMLLSRRFRRLICALSLALFCHIPCVPEELPSTTDSKFPYPEKLSYHVEWRLISAGSVTVDLTRDSTANWQTSLHLESAGWVSRLYKVLDNYKATSNANFCGDSSYLDAEEGKRHSTTRLTFDNGRHKVEYDEHDLVKHSSETKELEIAPCTYEITGALSSLRGMDLPPGKWATFPITDGKKMAHGKIEAQAKESLNIGGKNYSTVRYEAFLFDNVLYKRKGRLLIWMTDDADRLPVQFRLMMGFPIGTVTVELDKQQKM